jgi:hypothetical protein
MTNAVTVIEQAPTIEELLAAGRARIAAREAETARQQAEAEHRERKRLATLRDTFIDAARAHVHPSLASFLDFNVEGNLGAGSHQHVKIRIPGLAPIQAEFLRERDGTAWRLNYYRLPTFHISSSCRTDFVDTHWAGTAGMLPDRPEDISLLLVEAEKLEQERLALVEEVSKREQAEALRRAEEAASWELFQAARAKQEAADAEVPAEPTLEEQLIALLAAFVRQETPSRYDE